MTDICFLDTETLGLHPDAPVWEFAAIRRFSDSDSISGWDSVRYGPHGAETYAHFTIQHDPAHWLDGVADQFVADYRARYRWATAWGECLAAAEIHRITAGAQIVACNPVFDEPRLAKLLRRNGIEPEWHYHPDDISSIVKGYLAARGELPDPPHKSEVLSTAVGVLPAAFERHTAMGDVLWTRAQWDAVMTNQTGDQH